MSNYKEIDLTKVITYSISDRTNKVDISEFANIHKKGSSFLRFWESLPKILVSKELRELVGIIVRAFHSEKPVIIMMGAHVIKCGLNPLIIDLMEKKIVSCLALNGAGVIHDTETAYWGTTSENVAEALNDGSFGMVEETPAIINTALINGRKKSLGYGEAVGKKIFKDDCPNKNVSILAKGYELKIPITVHVALGTDIVHQHGNSNGAIIGELTYRDFKIFCHQISQLGNGGVLLNFGSAVILPEVFLKALTVVRNLGFNVHSFFTANFDMLRHYRPQVNVIQRPTQTGGKGFQFIGHHEIMIPLLIAGIIEGIENTESYNEKD